MPAGQVDEPQMPAEPEQEPNAAPVEEDPEETLGYDSDEVIKDAKEHLEACNIAYGENRGEELDDLNFLAGEHWDPEVKRIRELDGRPCLTINKLPTFLHQVTNDQRQNVPGIKVSAVSMDAEPEGAEIRQGMIRHIEYASNADVAYDTAVNSAAAIGEGYFEIITDFCKPDGFDQDIKFHRIANSFTVYPDPLSDEPDGSDQKRAGISLKMTRSAFEKDYPSAKATSQAFDLAIGDPTNKDWVGKDFVRVMKFYRIEEEPAVVVELSNGETGYKDELLSMPPGVTVKRSRKSFRPRTMLYKLTAIEVLEATEIKCPFIPVFPVYGDELNVDGKIIRAGLVRNAKDPSRMYNFWMPLSLDTRIPTPKGWSTIGTLRAGDQVFADTGEPTTVIGKSPVYVHRECYRITFGDGTSVVADAEHPWMVMERGKRVTKGFDWQRKKLRTDQLDPSQHTIERAHPIATEAKRLPLDPYFLGVWLGDGTSGSGTITSGQQDCEPMRAQIAARGFDVGRARCYGTKAPQFTVHGAVEGLRSLSVLGNKHIPDEYLRASVDQRMELLRGLMDTDGSATKNQCVFYQSNLVLAAQVRELLVSLGFRVSWHERAGRVSMLANGQQIVSGAAIQLAFQPDGRDVFCLPRKLAKQAHFPRQVERRADHKIVSVERVTSVPVQCIAIDAPTHLFLCTDAMIPTHNTSATEEVALRPKVPFIGAEGQFEGYEDDWSQANVRSFPYMEYKPVSLEGSLAPPPQRQQMADIPAGALQMAMHANDNIKATTGLFDSSLGARGNATSGIQERAQQRQGDVANFHFSDNLARTVRHAGRCILAMIPHYYDAHRVVQIMGEDEKVSSVEINKPAPAAPQMDINGQPQQGGSIDQSVATTLNDMTQGDYAATVRAGPSYDTLRQEAAASMAEWGKNWPKLMDIAGDKVMRVQDWPGADEIADRVAKTIPPELRDDPDEQAPMVQTPKGPIPIEQAGQMLAEMDQQIQQMGQALQEAQSGTEKAKIDADSRIKVAEINAVSKSDVAELTGLVQLLIAKIQPPPALAAEVASDVTKDGGTQTGAVQ